MSARFPRPACELHSTTSYESDDFAVFLVLLYALPLSGGWDAFSGRPINRIKHIAELDH